jgi:O-methyltransferase
VPCLHKIKDKLEAIKDLPGHIIEFGVYQGESAKALMTLFPGSLIHLCDTFCGMPEELVLPMDGDRRNEFGNTSVEKVQKQLDKVKINGTRYELYPGIFPGSVARMSDDVQFKLAHIDVDLYLSTKAAIEWVWPRMVHGGLVVDDDYAYKSCMGAKLAIDEFAKRGDIELIAVGQSVVFWKP